MAFRPAAQLLTAALLVAPVLACAAPAARPAAGPVADAVRQGIASGAAAFDHAAWHELLARHVDGEGRVDYAGFRKERAALDAYLKALSGADLARLSRGELLALLINAYNACTVKLIVDAAKDARFPASIRDLPDPWGRPSCALLGRSVSLDSIEHGLLRALFRDNRIHAAVNCASKSCPALVPWAYRGDRIEEQLEQRVNALVQSPAHVRVEAGRLRVSRIFGWYGDDFVDASFSPAARSVADYIRVRARGALRAQIEALGPSPKLDFLDYDWTLNAR